MNAKETSITQKRLFLVEESSLAETFVA